MDKLIAKADVLLEALPYMRRFAGKSSSSSTAATRCSTRRSKSGFAEDVVLLKSLGLRPVIVHGGGPQIEEGCSSASASRPAFVRGMRVTDEATMEIVEMVLGGQINKGIVADDPQARRQGRGPDRQGRRPADRREAAVRVEEKGRKAEAGRRRPWSAASPAINPEILEQHRRHRLHPGDRADRDRREGRTYNVNADVAAAEDRARHSRPRS